jgi:pilus assembly protein Flp/PilA
VSQQTLAFFLFVSRGTRLVMQAVRIRRVAIRREWQARGSRKESGGESRRKISVEGAKTMIKKFMRDETGLELSEYAVAAALVALAVITAFTTLGTNIGAKISNLAAKIGT